MTELMMPGDRLATSEEYIPGQGTYEHQGIIYAAVIGMKDFDQREMVARVKSSKPTGELQVGDIVLGEVVGIGSSLAKIQICGVENSSSSIDQSLVGALHVSKIMADFVNDARHYFRIGDLVRARVAQMVPSIQLATDDEALGVLKARCLKCRAFLFNKDGKFYCSECEREESRKAAGDFQRYTPYFEE